MDLDGSAHFSDAVQVEVPAAPDPAGSAPRVIALAQNYPNPFNPSTELQFTVASAGRAEVRLYDAIGRQVATLFDGFATPGDYYVVKVDGSRLASGVYFATLSSGGKMQTRKMLLQK